MEDASLDEFVSGGDENSDGGPEDGEPATPTSRWEPDGAACDACGETVRRRWQTDGQYVCRSCKEW